MLHWLKKSLVMLFYHINFDQNGPPYQFASFSAIAQVYNDDGSEAYDKRDYSNAVYFYTEGIKVNCKDKDLMAELYSNRAHAHLCLGEAICIFQRFLRLRLVIYKLFSCSPNIPCGLSRRLTHRKCGLLLL